MKKEILGKCMLLMSALIWGSSFIVMKNAVDFISPFTLLCIRFVLSTIFISILFFNKIKKIKKQDLLGGFLAGGNTITIGDIQAFIQYVRQFNQPIAQLAQTMNMLQSTAAAAERVFEFLEEEELEPETVKIETDEVEKLHGSVTFNQVNFGYLPEKTIIHDFNMHVHAGQTVAIVGPTGAGKTTIINLILGFYKINSGNILFDGKNMDDISLESIRKNISFIQQNPYIFDDTIKRNIIINDNNTISDEKLIDILKQVGLYDKIKNFENGIYEKVKDSSFSKGEKQLLAFARAIAKETSIYIFDEPTSNIDVESENQLKKVIDNLSKDSTVIIIAHRPATIENVDKVLKVEEGKVVQVKEK